MRGPVWKSWIREPNALKIEATCTPVEPPPMTKIDGGTEVKAQASLWVLVSSNPGTGSRRLTPPVQMMIFSAWIRSPLSVFVLEELHAHLERVAAQGLKLIFTGTGDVFASGADLREIVGLTSEKAREFALYGQSLMNRISATESVADRRKNGVTAPPRPRRAVRGRP